ncbi:MAG: hypothetical protein KGJ02_07285 [Verrucomicrobiota bacterium]|nr:hypothetical protein [Verrucomicrobiota bacterium]
MSQSIPNLFKDPFPAEKITPEFSAEFMALYKAGKYEEAEKFFAVHKAIALAKPEMSAENFQKEVLSAIQEDNFARADQISSVLDKK